MVMVGKQEAAIPQVENRIKSTTIPFKTKFVKNSDKYKTEWKNVEYRIGNR